MKDRQQNNNSGEQIHNGNKKVYPGSNKFEAQKRHNKHEKLVLEATQYISRLESVQKSVIINHISMNKLNTLIYLTISDFRSDKSVHEISIQNRVL